MWAYRQLGTHILVHRQHSILLAQNLLAEHLVYLSPLLEGINVCSEGNHLSWQEMLLRWHLPPIKLNLKPGKFISTGLYNWKEHSKISKIGRFCCQILENTANTFYTFRKCKAFLAWKLIYTRFVNFTRRYFSNFSMFVLQPNFPVLLILEWSLQLNWFIFLPCDMHKIKIVLSLTFWCKEPFNTKRKVT